MSKPEITETGARHMTAQKWSECVIYLIKPIRLTSAPEYTKSEKEVSKLILKLLFCFVFNLSHKDGSCLIKKKRMNFSERQQDVASVC